MDTSKTHTTQTETTELLAEIRETVLDLIDAAMDLARAEVGDVPFELERIDNAHNYVLDCFAGKKRRSIPASDLVFTLGAILDVLSVHYPVDAAFLESMFTTGATPDHKPLPSLEALLRHHHTESPLSETCRQWARYATRQSPPPRRAACGAR